MPDTIQNPEFCHLHCHTQYSLLDGASQIDAMIAKAKADGQPAVAITDHGNMFGVFKFHQAAVKQGIKPIIGCEFYLVEDRHRKKFSAADKDKRYHQLLLAKNARGYKNISKLCSLGFIEGYYSKYPRIDFELLEKYSEGLIATTCCAAAMVPRTFLEKGPEEAEKIFKRFHKIFGDDYYVELQRHGLKEIDQDAINTFLVELAQRHGVKVIATNDSHYINREDYLAHDVLLCVSTGSTLDIQDRFRFENDQFYFKTRAEMYDLFRDLPQALVNTMEIVEKVDTPDLKRDILLPNYILPEGYASETEYLRHLAYEGAKKRYGELRADVKERLDYELRVVDDMGFSGYFLIVQDFVAAARKLGVWVGPGRGSAAGSAVAYCTGITSLDPLKYNLLFERFLNPERITMPDIDIDFDDDGRQRVIDYVVEKYGRNQVAQIITFGKMAARSSIRDVGRVLNYPLNETDKLAKLVPEGPGVTLAKAIAANPDLKKIRNDKNSEAGKVVRLSEQLEGSIRQRGIHAAGVIIAPDDITEYIPVCTAKDTDLLVTQFEGKLVESSGMLKMDFLGLKTLSILKDAVENIKRTHDTAPDLANLPLDDEKTYQLFQKGETIGIFQFESEGMRKYLRELKPSNIEDLIAMNALYRPGPMDYIPEFIDRKFGRKPVDYPHPLLEDILKPTYGIMVYQEQIMQTAQIIAGYSLGKADILRRAMGKKQAEVMEQQRGEFLAGAEKNGIDRQSAGKIFDVMAKFAKYGFNRSHSAAYSMLAYQTAYLKAHYPAEYMAAVLTHNMSDIKKVNFFLDECRKKKIPYLGPDINESGRGFVVNKKGIIRFGLSAIKGLGEAAVESILAEREKKGPFRDYFDFVQRVNLRTINKKCLESLCMAGAFDVFGIYRSQFLFTGNGEKLNLIEQSIRFGQLYQQQKQINTNSLFGDMEMATVTTPPIPKCEPWPKRKLLQHEKEVTGMYISGNPLEEYELELRSFCTHTIGEIQVKAGITYTFAGIVDEVVERMDKRGRKFARFRLEDHTGSINLALFRENYLEKRHLLSKGTALFVKGIYKPWSRDNDTLQFNITELLPLETLKHTRTRSINLTIPLKQVNDEINNRLAKLVKSHKGKMSILFNIYDPEDNVSVLMSSNHFKVDLDDDLLRELENLEGVEVTLVQ